MIPNFGSYGDKKYKFNYRSKIGVNWSLIWHLKKTISMIEHVWDMNDIRLPKTIIKVKFGKKNKIERIKNVLDCIMEGMGDRDLEEDQWLGIRKVWNLGTSYIYTCKSIS